jgi:5'-methylthioadenosine phosphorylase
MSALAVILGSAFDQSVPAQLALTPREIPTAWGTQLLYETAPAAGGHRACVLFRHGLPHRLLPNQINYRAQAAALRQLGCRALLINSSVGVLDPAIPLFTPMLVSDLLMPENRLPDGSTCTMFVEPSPEHGHLVVNEGLFSTALSAQIHAFAPDLVRPATAGLIFAYAGGPRTKTAAENQMLARLGAQVNSMTLAPEVVLANELGIPCAGLVVGHKYSVPGVANLPESGIRESLEASRIATENILIDFLRRGTPVPFANHLYRW